MARSRKDRPGGHLTQARRGTDIWSKRAGGRYACWTPGPYVKALTHAAERREAKAQAREQEA